MSLQDRNVLVDLTSQSKQDEVAETQQALRIQGVFAGIH